MGDTTTINTPIASAVKPINRIRARLHGIDIPLLIAVLCLLVFGLMMVYSSSWKYSMQLGESYSYVFTRQLIWATVGIVVAFGLSFINYHRYRRLVVPMMYITLFLLILVLFWVGETRLGAKRALFGGSVQPSELAKLVIIIYLSFWLYSKREKLNQISFGLAPLIVMLGITAGLIMGEPDLSAAVTVVILGGIMFFVAGGDLKQIVLVLVVTILLGWIVVSINATGKARLADYIVGMRDPLQASYQVKRSMEAIVRGGVFGVGIGQSTTKFTGLPVAPTDSIFAVITEETGLLGAFFTVALYGVFLWRGLRIAQKAPDLLGKLLASGITVWLFFEAFVNMAAMVNLMPFAGNALPLISAGGSSLVTAMAGIGLLFGINRFSSKASESGERSSHNAVVDLRGRDRRRRIPRPGRSASSR
jgi:cell division protein FtsW